MADNTLVNGQITDSVTQNLVATVASAPANAAGNFANVSAQAFGLMMENAVTAQQSLNTINAAVIARGISLVNYVESDGERLMALLTALRAGTPSFPPGK